MSAHVKKAPKGNGLLPKELADGWTKLAYGLGALGLIAFLAGYFGAPLDEHGGHGRFGAAYLVGFGTDHGSVAAAHDWDGPMELMQVRPARPDSYERLCHEAEVPAFFLPLREPRRPEVRDELSAARLERAIGVVYRPETELQSHYFHAVLPHQFDEWIWIDETHAVHPVTERESLRLPLAHPFSGHGRA